MLQCNTPEELAKMVEDLHGPTEIMFRGKLVTFIALDDDLNAELEKSYLQAQADIAADPSLREQIEKARKNFDEGRFYTTDQAIDLK
jgi:hypothetical protein